MLVQRSSEMTDVKVVAPMNMCNNLVFKDDDATNEIVLTVEGGSVS